MFLIGFSFNITYDKPGDAEREIVAHVRGPCPGGVALEGDVFINAVVDDESKRKHDSDQGKVDHRRQEPAHDEDVDEGGGGSDGEERADQVAGVAKVLDDGLVDTLQVHERDYVGGALGDGSVGDRVAGEVGDGELGAAGVGGGEAVGDAGYH